MAEENPADYGTPLTEYPTTVPTKAALKKDAEDGKVITGDDVDVKTSAQTPDPNVASVGGDDSVTSGTVTGDANTTRSTGTKRTTRSTSTSTTDGT